MIFLISLIACTAPLYTGNAVRNNILHQCMARFAEASAREIDGASNLMLLNGEEGYIGDTGILVQYQKKGYIEISGSNSYDK